MRTDTDRLNWLIENEAYSLLDSDNYGPEWWFERSRFELVRETIDIAMDAPIAEEEAKVILLAVQRQRQGMPSGRKQKQAEL